MSLDHVVYYRRRAAEERALALQSRSVQVAQIHKELAESYEKLVKNAAFLPITFSDDDED